MPAGFQSTLLLTVLLAIGLVFFLRAASKDRTTVVDVSSPKPPLEVLETLTQWLEARLEPDWRRCRTAGLRFRARWRPVAPVGGVAVRSCSHRRRLLRQLLQQLIPQWHGWPLLLIGLGPLAGLVYDKRAARSEASNFASSKRATRSRQAASCVCELIATKLIAIELELSGVSRARQ